MNEFQNLITWFRKKSKSDSLPTVWVLSDG